jgi:hypothetical protein
VRPSARRGLRTESETRNVRSKCRCSCVLQFTCRRAFCGVLHRPTCQVIHRSGLYLRSDAAYAHASVAPPSRAALPCALRKRPSTPIRPLVKGFFLVRGARPPPRGATAALLATGVCTANSFKTWARPRKGTRRYRYRDLQRSDRRSIGRPGAPAAHARSAPATGSPSRAVHAPQNRSSSALAVMILPQVHLRKPCYDFYFL